MIPRVTAPAVKPTVSSPGLSGGVRMSWVRPCIFSPSSEEDELAKALLSTVIMIRPGARNTT